ncbi:MAG: hypothetical protein HOI95_05790 [Chromatiales bacterium]|jgi:hypothetical protein|nr:hypothetical protein [Chromatiales bacterium]
MSQLSGEFVAALARTWHRFEPPEQDLESLAAMLRPMDEAGEELSSHVEFDMEPSDYLVGLDAMADVTRDKGRNE